MSETPESNSTDAQSPLSPISGPSYSNANDLSSSKLTPTGKVHSEHEQIQESDALGLTRSESEVSSALEPFDWDAFTAQHEAAIADATEGEKAIMKEVESLSRYFGAWASAASVHDDERAAKRLQTRQRFVNLSEETMTQKQKHYEEVVRAFESALALLRST